MFDFVGIGVLVLLTVLFGFLAFRSWGVKNAIIKWGGLVLSGLLTLVCGLVLVVALLGFGKLNANYNSANPVSEIQVAGTPEQLARGERLAQICTGCHSPNGELPLAGHNFFEGGGPPIGTLYAPNLTPTHLQAWSDGELIRAIREGIHRDGRSLLIMPAENFKYMSDEDVQAIVAFLRAQPAIEPDTPPTQISLVGALLINVAPFQTRQEPVDNVSAPPEGPTAEYGQYLVNIIGCKSCHGPNFEGGDPSQQNGPPPGPNLTKVLPNWSEEEFITFFRTGQLPSGGSVTETMPWREIDRLATDDDLKAMFAYLHDLTPVDGPAD